MVFCSELTYALKISVNINVEIAIMFLPKIHIAKYTVNIRSWDFQWASPPNSTVMGGCQCATKIWLLSPTLQGGIFFPPISLPSYNNVMFCNTHSNFADIIQAEIFEPELSKLNSQPFTRLRTLPHISVHFWMIPTFSEPSDRVPRAIPQPCLQILRSITLALIVSNCLSFSCCIMIRDIAPMLLPFVPSEYCLHSSCVPDLVSSSI